MELEKKNILIIGPIGDFGGRELEVNIIARALENTNNINILSTGYLTSDSFALNDLKKTVWNSVPKILFKTNLFVNFLSKISKFKNRGKFKSYGYVDNNLIKKIINLDKKHIEILQAELNKVDLVILCVQLTTKFLKEIIEYCHEKKIPVIIRTTGTIRTFNINEYGFLKKVNLFIHHSEANAKNLNSQIQLPYIIIDQCALYEKSLLDISSSKRKSLKFGYLGRLSEEKGIIPIANFFSKTSYTFIVAGDGPQKNELLNLFTDKVNCNYIGLLNSSEIDLFFNQIDILIIPSFEESGPLVALEAMVAGKIIISTKVGAMAERLDNNNVFWFNIENLSSLEEAINLINQKNNFELEHISESIRKVYLKKYSYKVIKEEYVKVIQEYI